MDTFFIICISFYYTVLLFQECDIRFETLLKLFYSLKAKKDCSYVSANVRRQVGHLAERFVAIGAPAERIQKGFSHENRIKCNEPTHYSAWG